MYELKKLQLKQLADFCSNLSLVFIASAITPIFSSVDEINLFMVLSGLVVATISLTMSMILLKGLR